MLLFWRYEEWIECQQHIVNLFHFTDLQTFRVYTDRISNCHACTLNLPVAVFKWFKGFVWFSCSNKYMQERLRERKEQGGSARFSPVLEQSFQIHLSLILRHYVHVLCHCHMHWKWPFSFQLVQLSVWLTAQATVIFTYSAGCDCPHVPGSPVSCLNDSSVIGPRLHQRASTICERLW